MNYIIHFASKRTIAGIAQLGERQTEDLKVTCSIHVHRIFISSIIQPPRISSLKAQFCVLLGCSIY